MDDDSDAEMLRDLNANNYKGFHLDDTTAEDHYIDPVTGAHFEFHSLVKALYKIKLMRNEEELSEEIHGGIYRKPKRNTNPRFIWPEAGPTALYAVDGDSSSTEKAKRSLKWPSMAQRLRNGAFLGNVKTFDMPGPSAILPVIRLSHIDPPINRTRVKQRKDDFTYLIPERESYSIERDRSASSRIGVAPESYVTLNTDPKTYQKYLLYSRALAPQRNRPSIFPKKAPPVDPQENRLNFADETEFRLFLERQNKTRNSAINVKTNRSMIDDERGFGRERSSIVRKLLLANSKIRNNIAFKSI